MLKYTKIFDNIISSKYFQFLDKNKIFTHLNHADIDNHFSNWIIKVKSLIITLSINIFSRLSQDLKYNNLVNLFLFRKYIYIIKQI